MLGNHETGVLQPVAEIAALCRKANVPVHTDATQVVGKLPVDCTSLGVDALSFSGHKFHGPAGIGGLLLRSGVKLQPLHYGGFQQAGLRPGTESAPLAAGLHAALQLWHDEADDRARRMTALRDRFEATLHADLSNIVVHGIVVHGAASARLPHTSGIAFLGLDRQALLMALDQAGVACSTGSACASGSSEPSPVLLAMGCPTAEIEGSLRFSLGAFTTPADVDQAAHRISSVVNHLRNQKSPAKSPATSRQ
jgi:cysteine desulfurase